MGNQYIAQVVFQSNTGLPKDRFVNTWHFVGGVGGGDGSEMLGCAARLAAFYCQTYTGLTIGEFLSSGIERVATVNVYDYNQPKPRIPFPFHFTLPAATNPIQLPEEVALVMSYYSARNLPRQRGRVYIGPLCTNAIESTATVTSRPNALLFPLIQAAAADLMATGDGADDFTLPLLDGLFLTGLAAADLIPTIPSALLPHASFPAVQPVNWAQFSAVGAGTQPTKKHPDIPTAREPAFSLVTAGWIDNEWDGQRRRRVASSARSVF